MLVVLTLLLDLTSTLELGRCGAAHDSVAAFDAAGGGRVRKVFGIFDEVFSLGFDRGVFNMPPFFFSGLGVLARSLDPEGGARFGDVALCILFALGTSSRELLLVA